MSIKYNSINNNSTPLLVIHSFPGCLESPACDTVITVEDDRHCVSWADEGTWLAGATIFLFIRPKGYRDPVPDAGRMGLKIKSLKGELDPLSRGDFKVPCLTKIMYIVVSFIGN